MLNILNLPSFSLDEGPMVVYHWDQSTLAPKMSTNSCFQKKQQISLPKRAPTSARKRQSTPIYTKLPNEHQNRPNKATSNYIVYSNNIKIQILRLDFPFLTQIS